MRRDQAILWRAAAAALAIYLGLSAWLRFDQSRMDAQSGRVGHLGPFNVGVEDTIAMTTRLQLIALTALIALGGIVACFARSSPVAHLEGVNNGVVNRRKRTMIAKLVIGRDQFDCF